ncbi:phosphatase PAP2 family protein [Pedobacter hartonius]|uniref:PAP2 superfamily protein n=1 Tax=Pedobacter hartonius TaxID=425514 RepID=A0A1H4AP98_9SPHI|nr:phosphatase PAP2 family protein [Pedobacter hartonius]SEA37562.1 PAP2 superfamily protein [Pedobacter hartonius]
MSEQLGSNKPFYTIKDIIVITLMSLFYISFSYFLVGFNPNQIVLVVIFNSLYYISAATRKFMLGFSIFTLYWILFDYMKAFPNYTLSSVHIADLYHMEKHIFGIFSNGKVLTPNEYWRIHHSAPLDFIGGIFYLMWIPVPLAFAAYLFFIQKELFIRFSLTFVFVNLLGFIVYYTYPAAPPWYVQYHGFTFIPHTHSNPAGLIRFDHLMHISIFQLIYRQGSNVFAAMPSLHSSYPMIVLYYGLKNKMGAMNLVFGVVMLGIWFTAVYASHHYVLDVLAGITCAIVGITLFNWLLKHTILGAFVQKMHAVIT